jgi:outer membrane protein assembly factor BamB
MTGAQAGESTRRKPLRLWPGVVAVAMQWFVWLVVPIVLPGAGGIAILGGLAGGLAVVVWWLFFSRAPWTERLGAIVLMVAAVFATYPIVHESIANGFMGMMLPVVSIPLLSLALVASAASGRYLSSGHRFARLAAATLLACGATALVRTGGITGDAASDLHWRWTPTPAERLLAMAADESSRSARAGPSPPAAAAPPAEHVGAAPEKPAAAAPGKAVAPSADKSPDSGEAKARAGWPGFRGPARDGVVRGVRLESDWSRSPPVELWRRPIGPGWSSFAVLGDLVYTQEQRGENEVVSSYRLGTGEPVWLHGDAVRFWESNGGAGPRATPTLHNGRVYTLGATGIVNALDARNGTVAWSRNAAADTGRKIPDWGLAGSPLAIDDLVILAVAGQLVAYDAATGHPRWFGPGGGGGYSSPHLATIDGVAQVLLLRGARTLSVSPADGQVLWEHSRQGAVSIVQPALTGDGDVLVASGDAMGGNALLRLGVSRGSTGWTVEERWSSRGLKPYFNDFVVHEGHAFGFDGSILACVDLADGTRKWKGGRYGHGQLLLLPDQDVMLVLSEEGELALVGAVPDRFTELARRPAIDGKTWNHPVLVGDVLLIRNGEEMAAFRLPLAGLSR